MDTMLYETLAALAKREEDNGSGKNKNLTREELEYWAWHCTPEICDINTSFYYYRVSLVANAIFLALFGLSFVLFAVAAIFTFKRSTRSDHAFTFAMMAGCFLEILGYVGRIMSWYHQWAEPGFLMQIVCLTIAPAFLAGGIYLCLRRIVGAFGAQNSRLKPKMYTRIFIPCDILSLVLQAAGGGIASAKSHAREDPELGNNIMIAGLAIQVITLFAFICLSLDFAFRTWSRHRKLGASSMDQSPALIALRKSVAFKGFLAALALATIGIFWRSVYRVAELAQGWDGALIRKQNLFIAFEGVMVIVAVMALNVFHPAVCFGSKVHKANEEHNEMGDFNGVTSGTTSPHEKAKESAAVSSNGSTV